MSAWSAESLSSLLLILAIRVMTWGAHSSLTVSSPSLFGYIGMISQWRHLFDFCWGSWRLLWQFLPWRRGCEAPRSSAGALQRSSRFWMRHTRRSAWLPSPSPTCFRRGTIRPVGWRFSIRICDMAIILVTSSWEAISCLSWARLCSMHCSIHSGAWSLTTQTLALRPSWHVLQDICNKNLFLILLQTLGSDWTARWLSLYHLFLVGFYNILNYKYFKKLTNKL